VHHKQGDRIGRIFAHWAIVFFGQFFYLCKRKPKQCGLLLTTVKVGINFDNKMGRKTIWAIFTQTHTVTFITRQKNPSGKFRKKILRFVS
jgi:hypothetical protein